MFNESREGMFPSWLLWVIGPVTVIAAALIVFAVVLGIRAGQRQIETQRRQEVGIALQRAADYQAEGRLQEAVAEYRRVLMLDPGNEYSVHCRPGYRGRGSDSASFGERDSDDNQRNTRGWGCGCTRGDYATQRRDSTTL
jgi:hypothetical protein